MKSTTVTKEISIEEIRNMIEVQGFNWSVQQSKQEFKTHLEEEGQLAQYLNEEGNLIRSEFNSAYEDSEYANKSVQEYYGLNAKGITDLRALDAVKEAKIRRPASNSSSSVSYNFVMSNSSSSMSDSLEDNSNEQEETAEQEQEIPTFS